MRSTEEWTSLINRYKGLGRGRLGSLPLFCFCNGCEGRNGWKGNCTPNAANEANAANAANVDGLQFQKREILKCG